VFIESKMMEVVVTTGTITRAKLYSQIVTTKKPTPNFLQSGCPSCRLINSVRALKRRKQYLTTIKSNRWTPQEIRIHKTVLPSASFVSVAAAYFLFLLTVLLACSAALSTLDVTVAL